VELLRPSSLAEVDGGLIVHGATEVVPLLRDGILQAETLVDVRDLVPSGIEGHRIGAGTTLAAVEASADVPEALREACRLAASPQLRHMGSLGGNLLQSTRCWYWRLRYPCRLHGGERCHAADGEHREHAIFANDFCASAHPSDVAAALLAYAQGGKLEPVPDGLTAATGVAACRSTGEPSRWSCRTVTAASPPRSG